MPAAHAPPENAEELLAKAYMRCCECASTLIDLNKRVFWCETCSPDIASGDAVYWCKPCKESCPHEHKRSKLRGVPGLPPTEQANDEEQPANEEGQHHDAKTDFLDSLFDEYHQLDFEDAIGSG